MGNNLTLRKRKDGPGPKCGLCQCLILKQSSHSVETNARDRKAVPFWPNATGEKIWIEENKKWDLHTSIIRSPHTTTKIQWDTKRSLPKRNHPRYKVQHTHHSMESTQSDTKYKTSISE